MLIENTIAHILNYRSSTDDWDGTPDSIEAAMTRFLASSCGSNFVVKIEFNK